MRYSSVAVFVAFTLVACGGSTTPPVPTSTTPSAPAVAERPESSAATPAPVTPMTSEPSALARCLETDLRVALACGALSAAAPPPAADVEQAGTELFGAQRGGPPDRAAVEAFVDSARRLECVNSGPTVPATVRFWLARAILSDEDARSEEASGPHRARGDVPARFAWLPSAEASYSASALLFDAAFRQDPAGEFGEYAAYRALDSVNRVYEASNSAPECLASLAEMITRYRAACTPARRRTSAEFCEQLDEFACNVLGRNADAGASFAEASLAYESAANDSACARGERRDEYLYNAARFAERAGDLSRASNLRAELSRRFPDSAYNRAH